MLLHVLCSVFLAIYYRILSQDFSSFQVALIYNLATLVVVLPFVIRRRAQLMKSNILLHCSLMALCTFLAQVAIIIAHDNMPFAQVAAVKVIYPLSTTVAAVMFLKEKIYMGHVCALIVGCVGAIIIVNPSDDFNFYSLFALSAVIFWTTSDMITNKITYKEDVWNQVLLVLLFMGLFSVLSSALFFTVTGNSFAEIKNHYWMLFLLIGIIAAFWRLYIILAVGKAEVNVVTPFYFAIFPMSSLAAYFVFGETVKIRTVIGAVMIIVSMIYISFKEYKAAQLKS